MTSSALIESFEGELLECEPLARHTYYRIGGPADFLAFPKNLNALSQLGKFIQERRLPYFILGQGSNLLVSDDGFRGVVIRMSKLDLGIELEEGGLVRTGASVAISSLLRKCGAEGWAGLEFLAGIPGSVGGAVYMNAGTHLGESKDRLDSVTLVDLFGGAREVRDQQLVYMYRQNGFILET